MYVCMYTPSCLLIHPTTLHSPSGKGIISGHADGTIVRYFFEEDGAGLARVRVGQCGQNKTCILCFPS